MPKPKQRRAPSQPKDIALMTGRDYVASLRDGRRVRVLGGGAIDDVTTHPLTAPVVGEYAAWYDRHRDPAWRDRLLRDATAPWAFAAPRSAGDLRHAGAAIHAVLLLAAGNLTHTPGYGHLIALGLLDAVATVAPDRVDRARAFLDQLTRSTRFLTFSSGGGPPSDKFRDPGDAIAVHVARRTRRGIVASGMVGVHTAVPFAHDVLVLGRHPAGPSRWAWFAVPLAAPGVRIVTRAAVARPARAFDAPLSARFDELDAVVWLDDVEIPDERVFALGEACDQRGRDIAVSWLLWHQTIGWLARADFTLGLAIALGEVLGQRTNPEIQETITDLLVDAETTRTCIAAAELDAETTTTGHALPRRSHLAPGALHALGARRRMDEALRKIAGAPALVAPAALDLDDAEIAGDLERAFGGGGYTARQRTALLRLAWDHLASSLAGREASYEMFGNGGVAAWRGRMRRWYRGYDASALAALRALDLDMTPKGTR
jgi:aromatic ring hydroxylase